MAPIAPISLPVPIAPIPPPASDPPAKDFQQILAAALSDISEPSATASSAISNYLAGGTQELHSTILATQEASLALELILQVRNKIASAYDEIMKMQI